MTTQTDDELLAARYTLRPGVGVGRITFGDSVTEHAELLLRNPEPDWSPDEDYAEYAVPGLEETLIVYVDGNGRVESASFYEFCRVEGRELIGMGVGELLVVLGVPSAIEAEEIGSEVELLYAYDDLGLTIWTMDGEVCVVQASRVDAG